MKEVLLFSSLLLTTLAATAQRLAYPYFVTAQTAGNRYEIYYRDGKTPPSSVNVTPWLISTGRYITPKIAAQLGFGYASSSYSSPGGYMIVSPGQVVRHDVFNNEDKQYVVPLVIRRALLRSGSQLQVDLLLGLAWVHYSFYQESHDELNGQITRQTISSNQADNTYASAGLGIRYAFGKHFEAVGDWVFNHNLRAAPAGQQAGGEFGSFTKSVNVGVRYRFNLRKPGVDAEQN